MKTGMVSDIQKFSLHDGPGIRTVVFLKGCNMRCVWCHNPEAIGYGRFLAFYPGKCILCGACYDACGTGALTQVFDNSLPPLSRRRFDRARCTACGTCVQVCAPQALKLIGREMTARDVLEKVMEDRPYYEASGGGVTLSGGEPLAQAEFSAEILQMCRDEGMDTAIETNLSFPQRVVEKLLPFLDRIFCDLKLLDDAEHIRTTGVSNATVLENLKWLSETGIPLTVRTPLIPGITDSDGNIRGIAAWLRANTAAR